MDLGKCIKNKVAYLNNVFHIKTVVNYLNVVDIRPVVHAVYIV